MRGQLYNNTHTIFGTVLFALILVQPILGLIQHYRYQVVHRETATGILHKWYGRVLIILAIVNGGLGLALAGEATGGGATIAYIVVSAVVFLIYVGVVAYTVFTKSTVEKF